MRNRTRTHVVRGRSFPALLALCLVSVGCLHQGSPSRDEEARAAPEIPADPNLITEAEIEVVEFQTAYEVIQALRPQWLGSRGINSFTDPTPSVADVVVDGTFVGDLEYLWTVSAMNVKELRFWGPGQAGVQFGMGFPRGVIEITSKGLPQ